jgi:TolA-binding protein
MERFKALRAKYPDSNLTAEVMWWLGEYYYRHDDLNLALRYFSSLIQDFPKSDLVVSCYYALGSIYAEELKYQDATDNFKKVMELGKSDIAGTGAVALGDIYVKQDKLDLAIDTYKDAVSKHPNLANLIYPKLADVYSKKGDYEQAADFYRMSLEVVSVRQMADIQFKLAEALQAQGKSQESVEEYLKVAYMYPDNDNLAVKSLLRVAAIYENKENFKEAVNIYKRVISLGTEEAKFAQERIDWIKENTK